MALLITAHSTKDLIWRAFGSCQFYSFARTINSLLKYHFPTRQEIQTSVLAVRCTECQDSQSTETMCSRFTWQRGKPYSVLEAARARHYWNAGLTVLGLTQKGWEILLIARTKMSKNGNRN